MSFSFVVAIADALPPFQACLEGCAFPWPVAIADGDAEGPWPRGRLARVGDAESSPSGPHATEQEGALLARLGLGLGFLLHSPGRSARGVEVRHAGGAVTVRVFALSSSEDYAIAVRFAASLASLANARVLPEHGVHGEPMEEAVSPAELVRLFDAGFADRHALEMSRGLHSSVGRSPIHIYTPSGWVRIPRSDDDTPELWQKTMVARLQRGEIAVGAKANDGIQELLFGAMLFTTAADGDISDKEQVAMGALAKSVPELRNADLEALLPRAVQALSSAHTHGEWVRRKAFVLAVEAVTRGNDGAYVPGDANFNSITALQQALAIPEAFAAAALFTARCKYVGGMVEDFIADTMVDAMLFVAAIDGEVSETELLTISLILATVPQFAGRNLAALLAGAAQRLKDGQTIFVHRLGLLPKFRDKTFTLACEVALAGGVTEATGRALAVLEQALPLTDHLANDVRGTFAAKYAAGLPQASTDPQDAPAPAARPAGARPPDVDLALVSLSAVGLREGAKRVAEGSFYFALLVTEKQGVIDVCSSKQPFLPHSVNELKAALASAGAVDRYALVYPGLSIALGTVIVVDSADRSKPQGVRTEQRYDASESPARLLGEPQVAGTSESLLFEPSHEGAAAFSIEAVHEGQRALEQAPWREPGAEWTFFECRFGEARFELSLLAAGASVAAGIWLGEGRLHVGSPEAFRAFIEAIAAHAGARAPAIAPPDAAHALRASVIILSTNAIRTDSGFLAHGGSWTVSKWTFAAAEESAEIYVNLQPTMKRGELRPKESTFDSALSVLARLVTSPQQRAL